MNSLQKLLGILLVTWLALSTATLFFSLFALLSAVDEKTPQDVPPLPQPPTLQAPAASADAESYQEYMKQQIARYEREVSAYKEQVSARKEAHTMAAADDKVAVYEFVVEKIGSMLVTGIAGFLAYIFVSSTGTAAQEFARTKRVEAEVLKSRST